MIALTSKGHFHYNVVFESKMLNEYQMLTALQALSPHITFLDNQYIMLRPQGVMDFTYFHVEPTRNTKNIVDTIPTVTFISLKYPCQTCLYTARSKNI